MKKIFIILCLATFAVSCGKKANKVSSADTSVSSTVVESNELSTAALVNFPGEYEIIQMNSSSCSATIRIVADNQCDGIIIRTNGYNPPEEFCNINRGEFRRNVDLDNRDRDPRNLDRNPDRNLEVQVVTMRGSQLNAVLKISDRISYTNTLVLDSNGILTKVTNLKSRESRCVYQKR